jgi:hypothetical protein
MRRLLVVSLLSLAANASAEEEKFYSIVGADGSIEIIRSSEVPAEKGKKKAKERAEKKAGAQQEEKAPDRSAVKAVAPQGGAKYDSDEYVDSELLDGKSPANTGKSRFYIINDEIGPQVSEGETSVFAGTIATPFAQEQPVEEPFLTVDEGMQELGAGESLEMFPGLPKCLSAEDIDQIKSLQPDRPDSIVIDKGLYGFLRAPGVVVSYRLGGDGLRTVVSSSFSRTDKKPGFVHPSLAFFDEQGCLTRVVRNFYESLYKATDKRHPMLRSRLAVHAEESFMMVLVPPEGQVKPVASLPYEYARFGQLKFTVKKQ